jgi:sugar lactone lactonase YvrE
LPGIGHGRSIAATGRTAEGLTVASDVGDDEQMRSLRRDLVTRALACVLALGVSGVIAVSAGDAAASGNELRVFDLPVSGPDPFRHFGPLARSEAVDMATLPNGDIVVFLNRRSPALTRIDQRTRGHELPVRTDIDPVYLNSVVAAADGALLFSDGGRVLRRRLGGRVVTVAGGPRRQSASGDGGPAVGAGMAPTGLALLADGSLLIADRRNHRIRRVDPTGRVSTVAGTGLPGSDGDGGPATSARLTAPSHLAAYPDGSYLIVHGPDYVRVRRVDPTGRITTVAGVGPGGTSQSCRHVSGPATSLRIRADEFTGGFAALPDGGFLIAAQSLEAGDESKAGGVMRVSADGIVTPVLCASSAYQGRAEGRDLYLSGRAVSNALTDFPPSDLAVTADGSIVLNYGDGNTSLRMLAAPGRSQRFAVAVAPDTPRSVFGGRVMITATDAAKVRVSVYRERRLVQATAGRVRSGENTLRLRRRLEGGVYDLRVLATTGDGRSATARMALLGRPRITIAYAKRRLRREIADSLADEGTGGLRLSDCRRHGPRRVRCRASLTFDFADIREFHSITLRPDGVLIFRREWRGRTLRSYAISP